MATHFSTLAWKIPWTEEPLRLQSMGLERVGHDWEASLSLYLLRSYSHLCPHFSVSCICLKPCMVLSPHLLLKGPHLTHSTARTCFRVPSTPCSLSIPPTFYFSAGIFILSQMLFPISVWLNVTISVSLIFKIFFVEVLLDFLRELPLWLTW